MILNMCILSHKTQCFLMFGHVVDAGTGKRRGLLIILPTDAVCCPNTNIEDVVLSNMIGEIAENTRTRSVFWFRIQSVQGLGFRVR